MTIRTISSGTTRDFSNEEVDALHRDDSTGAVLNAARRKTGDTGRDVSMQPGEAGLQRQLAKNKELDGYSAAAAAGDAVGMAGAVGIPVVPACLAVAAEVLLPLGSLAASQYGLASMQATKTDTRDAATRDVMRGAMLLSLELPSGYADAAMPRDVGTGGRSPAKKISDQLQGTALGTTLQLHCDQGIIAAEDFLASSSKSKEEHLAGRPKLAERYANDPAFKAGFDALVWAKQNAPGDYTQMLDNLRARDVRYAAAQVQVRA